MSMLTTAVIRSTGTGGCAMKVLRSLQALLLAVEGHEQDRDPRRPGTDGSARGREQRGHPLMRCHRHRDTWRRPSRRGGRSVPRSRPDIGRAWRFHEPWRTGWWRLETLPRAPAGNENFCSKLLFTGSELQLLELFEDVGLGALVARGAGEPALHVGRGQRLRDQFNRRVGSTRPATGGAWAEASGLRSSVAG